MFFVARVFLWVVFIMGVLAPFESCLAARTYTPEQLRGMVNSKNYPAQGSVTTHTENIGFDMCIAKVESVTSAISENYPVETVVSTNILILKKIWINDAAMTLTCSKPDATLVITKAPYK